jgi:hypothetical protein
MPFPLRPVVPPLGNDEDWERDCCMASENARGGELGKGSEGARALTSQNSGEAEQSAACRAEMMSMRVDGCSGAIRNVRMLERAAGT